MKSVYTKNEVISLVYNSLLSLYNYYGSCYSKDYRNDIESILFQLEKILL